MRRKGILASALLVSAFLMITATVQAQTVWPYQAEIPFDFVIGDSNYEAGRFTIDLERPNYLAHVLTIRNADGKRLERGALAVNGHRSRNDNTTLVFDRYEDIYVLKEILSPNFGFSVRKPGTATWTIITRNSKPKRDTVAIVLERR